MQRAEEILEQCFREHDQRATPLPDPPDTAFLAEWLHSVRCRNLQRERRGETEEDDEGLASVLEEAEPQQPPPMLKRSSSQLLAAQRFEVTPPNSADVTPVSSRNDSLVSSPYRMAAPATAAPLLSLPASIATEAAPYAPPSPSPLSRQASKSPSKARTAKAAALPSLDQIAMRYAAPPSKPAGKDKYFGGDKASGEGLRVCGSGQGFTAAYEKILSPLRAMPGLQLLELGIWYGKSLAMWCDYFDDGSQKGTATIRGIDIDLRRHNLHKPDLLSMGAYKAQ